MNNRAIIIVSRRNESVSDDSRRAPEHKFASRLCGEQKAILLTISHAAASFRVQIK
jgi:hypothetical protein